MSNGQRSSAAAAYIAPVLTTRPNLDVLVNTVVIKVLQTGNQSGKPVFLGVEFAQSASGKTLNIQNRSYLNRALRS